MPVITQARYGTFYGWRVVGAAFVLGAFGWGMGSFGPPVFLSVVRETRGWPLVIAAGDSVPLLLLGVVLGTGFGNATRCRRSSPRSSSS
jgi:hypothetical protein